MVHFFPLLLSMQRKPCLHQMMKIAVQQHQYHQMRELLVKMLLHQMKKILVHQQF
jgi:hypothetical protein